MDTMKESIECNMNANGGGLAVNITGKWESNRHAIAKMEKVTFGDCCKELAKKKNGGFKISATELLAAYRLATGCEPEWHHAGFLPKSYGSGMKKTYFLNEVPTVQQVVAWLKKATMRRVKNVVRNHNEKIREAAKMEFLKANATQFTRMSSTPNNFCVKLVWEMNGKYGWFESQSRYNLPEYVSGWKFESEEKYNEYNAL